MSDSETNTLSQTFSNTVLPQLFHSSPAQFIKFLERDGTKFLSFYWEQAREKLPQAMRTSSFGLNFRMYTFEPRTMLALVTLPEPAVDGEAYYSALVFRPDRRILLVTDMTRVFNLERSPDAQGNPATLLVQWTTRLQRVESVRGLPIESQAFVDAVMQHLDD